MEDGDGMGWDWIGFVDGGYAGGGRGLTLPVVVVVVGLLLLYYFSCNFFFFFYKGVGGGDFGGLGFEGF